MKNFRKIVAILAAALMLFSILPMSVFAAPGDVIVDKNFDDGTNGGFERSVNEDGYLVFDATTGDWQNTFAYIGGFQTNVDYVVSFKAKANKATTMNFKINDNWGADAAAFTVDVTTEWQDFEGTINMATLTSAIVMFSSNSTAADAAIYYIDDLKIVEKAEEIEVGVVANGDFENGSEGWTLNSSASIVDGALQIDNCGQWSEAAMANIAVEVGTEYTLSWQSKRVSGNGAFLMFVLKSDNSNHPTSGTNWMNETSGEWVENSVVFTAEDANLKLKLSAEVNDPGVILIDNITLKASPKVEVGKITNGDFETGDAAGWRTWQSTEINAAAAHTGSFGANIKGNGGWGGFLDQSFQVEDGKTYEFSFWYKVNASGFNWSLKGDQSGTSYGDGWETKGDWTQVTTTFIVNGDTSIYLNLNGSGTGVAEDAYIDDVNLAEVKDPSDDGFIKNGDFETGKATPWTLYSGTAVAAEAAKNGDYGLYIKNPTGGWGGTAYQDFAVETGKSYEVTMWAKALSQGQNIQIQNGGANVANAWFNKTEWTLLTFEFTATAANCRINICGGGTGANEEIYVDDIKVVELIDPSFDGYIYNGDFETGEVFPWVNLWDKNTVEIVEGMDGGSALSVISGKWQHVRQTNIAVEPNTWYKVTAWAKNASDMVLLVKDGGDSANLNQTGMNAGDEWTEFTGVFNSGDYTSVIVSLMGGENDEIAEKYGTFDNISMEVTEAPCEHEYEYDCSKVCSLCGEETRPEAEHSYFYPCDPVCMFCYEITNEGASHNIVAVEAVDATCTENGNIAYWYCSDCGAAWADEALTQVTNQRNVIIPASGHEYFYACDTYCMNCGEETNPDAEHNVIHVEAKEAVSCIEYGNREYWYCDACGTAWLDANLLRQTNQMSVRIAGECVSDSPACQDGVCINCGLPCPAEADHTYDDDYDATCNVCGEEREVEQPPVEDILYGDADGDGEITAFDGVLLDQYLAGWDVEGLNADNADVDGDGEITALDGVLLDQYLAGWDVTLGPVAEDNPLFNDAELGGW